ncbi:MAG TPA: ABC transporter permease [Bryobacteraceae bacterium]|nr:ABC transporter permease [Bryobacteraceae bacterium]
MTGNLAHIRYALRQFRLAPGFTATAVLTLALGIGGTTAIFTLIDAVMLRSLPVTDPSTLYRVGEGDNCCVQGGPQDKWGFYSYSLFQRLKEASPEFAEVTAFQAGTGRVSARRSGSNEPPRALRSEYVDGHYFSVFGVGALGGRVLTPSDDVAGATPVAVLSHHVWETIYGADPSIVGSTFMLDGHAFTVVGVAPPRFFGETLRGDPPDIWIPLHQEPTLAAEGSLVSQPVSAWLRMIGRLRAGASTTEMGPRLTGVLRRWMQYESQYPANWMPDIIKGLPRQIINVIPAGSGVEEMKDEYGRSLNILLAVCGLVLLIACANVANLLLVRSVGRRGQTALRLAIGATRRQIILQALAESVLLALGGGIAGLVVATAAARLLLSLAFSSAKFLPVSVLPSLPVLGFACAASLVTALIFGAAPAWFATRTDPAEALRGQGRGGTDRSSSASKVLLIVQATLSVVLIAGATMLSRSLNNLQHQDFGYQLRGRVAVALNSPPSAYPLPKLQSMYRQMEAHLNQIPGVRGAGLALYNPLVDNWGELIMVAGHPPGRMDSNAGSSWDRVSPDFLPILGMKMVRGRGLTASDNENTELVAVVNETFARRFFGKNEDPIGQHFGLDEPQYAGTFRIVGIVKDAKFAGFALNRPARPMFYVPLAQNVDYGTDTLMARIERSSHLVRGITLETNMPPGVLEPLVTKALAEVDPNLTVVNLRTYEDQVALRFDRQRAVATLASLFGIVALLLAAVGMYGVTAYGVARRTAEIGIRMALGADRAKVVRMVLRGASYRVLIGIAAGVPLAVVAGNLLAAELYGVTSWDPLALILAAGTLSACAFVAAVIPATRAASISPTSALRSE